MQESTCQHKCNVETERRSTNTSKGFHLTNPAHGLVKSAIQESDIPWLRKKHNENPMVEGKTHMCNRQPTYNRLRESILIVR